MSHRSAAVHHHRKAPPTHHTDQVRVQPQAGGAAAALPLRRGRTDYTFGHAGQQLRIGPIAFWIVVGTLVIMAVWTIGTATYFAFRDDVLTRLIRRQADMQFAYEDRIAEMRAQVDRVTSRQLLDQEQFEQKLDHVLRRQTELESRSTALGNLVDPTSTGSIRRQIRGSAGHPAKPSPISDTTTLSAPIGRGASLDGTLTRLRASLDHVEASQDAALRAMEKRYDVAAGRMRGVLASVGVDAAEAVKSAKPAGMGGPLVPLKLAAASPFERQIYRINVARAEAEQLTHVLGTVPIRKPLPAELDMTSGFGVRVDPFLGVPAMHTGLDFRASVGDPVTATAAGTVTIASWSGGYGKMVEINHGNGLASRYGHLSEILVKPGQKVRLGQTIGRVGSTGRSTGPHLHYETRVDGEAVDPHKFLRAGFRLSTGS